MKNSVIKPEEKFQVRYYLGTLIVFYTFSFGTRLLIVWGLWNALVPQLTGFEPISLLQVIGLMVLVYFLNDRPKFHIKTNREMYYTPQEGWRVRWTTMSAKERRAIIEGNVEEAAKPTVDESSTEKS